MPGFPSGLIWVPGASFTFILLWKKVLRDFLVSFPWDTHALVGWRLEAPGSRELVNRSPWRQTALRWFLPITRLGFIFHHSHKPRSLSQCDTVPLRKRNCSLLLEPTLLKLQTLTRLALVIQQTGTIATICSSLFIFLRVRLEERLKYSQLSVRGKRRSKLKDFWFLVLWLHAS